MGIALKGSHGHDDEINQYERKLVQVIFLHIFYTWHTGSNSVLKIGCYFPFAMLAIEKVIFNLRLATL